jgi:hypothetical protein
MMIDTTCLRADLATEGNVIQRGLWMTWFSLGVGIICILFLTSLFVLFPTTRDSILIVAAISIALLYGVTMIRSLLRWYGFRRDCQAACRQLDDFEREYAAWNEKERRREENDRRGIEGDETCLTNW